jgi:hypothetical protein
MIAQVHNQVRITETETPFGRRREHYGGVPGLAYVEYTSGPSPLPTKGGPKSGRGGWLGRAALWLLNTLIQVWVGFITGL